MKKLLLFITVCAAMPYNSTIQARAEFCKVITDQFAKINVKPGVQAPTFPNIPGTTDQKKLGPKNTSVE